MPTKNKHARKRAAENGMKVCIATKNILPREEMLRFVISPDRRVVFDVEEKLPGSGIWLTANKELLQLALDKRLFFKAARGTVHIPSELTVCVENQLKEKCLSLLSLTRKAGKLIFGFENVKKALNLNETALVFEATDAAHNGQNKLFRPHDTFPIFSFLTREELGTITGQDEQVHILILKSHLAERLISVAQKFNLYTQTKG